MIGLRLSSAAIQKQRWWPEGAIFAADFLNGRYMRDAAEIGFAAAFTFERTGPATMQNGLGNRVTFLAAMPRILPRIGALIEPAAVNLSRNTEDIGNAAGWSEGHLSFLDITGNDETGFKIATKSAATYVSAHVNDTVPPTPADRYMRGLHLTHAKISPSAARKTPSSGQLRRRPVVTICHDLQMAWFSTCSFTCNWSLHIWDLEFSNQGAEVTAP